MLATGWKAWAQDSLAKMLPILVLFMGKVRRGGYGFITWKGDHPARHLHLYKDGVLVGKWNLDAGTPRKGSASKRIRGLIAELEAEGFL